MRKYLDKIGHMLCDFDMKRNVLPHDIKKFKDESIIILTAGGKGMRMSGATPKDVNKNALIIDKNGRSAIERTVEMYRDSGFKSFLILVYTHADSIIDILGDGKSLDVSILYSVDPGEPIGRGGALLHALNQNFLNAKQSVIIHNPCDQIVNLSTFVNDIIEGHLHNRTKGHIATVVVTKETPYTFTGMKITDGTVDSIEMFPMIPVPAHIGVSVLDGEALSLFPELFSLTEKSDFENVLFPLLASRRMLGAVGVNYENWIAIKEPKSLEKIRNLLGYKEL